MDEARRRVAEAVNPIICAAHVEILRGDVRAANVRDRATRDGNNEKKSKDEKVMLSHDVLLPLASHRLL
jgi:hypothetical protein